MKYLLYLILLFFLANTTWSQQREEEENEYYRKNPTYIGLGLGMDFGGVGGKLEHMLLDYAGFFLGGGYNFAGLGLNGGLMIKPLAKKQVTPYILGMYGYTGTIIIQNASQLNMTDYGFSIGSGLEIKTENLNVWQIGIILPFRSQKFRDHHEYLKNHPHIEFDVDLLPIAFSVGFKFML